MAKLINQPTWWPNRKVRAAIISGVISGAVLGGAEGGLTAAGNPELLVLVEALAPYITAGATVLAAYLVREAAPEDAADP